MLMAIPPLNNDFMTIRALGSRLGLILEILSVIKCADIIDNAIKQEYRLINVEDNHELLDADDSLKSYSKATNNKELFATWHDTYHCEYATQGLFETDIAPYHIGKGKV